MKIDKSKHAAKIQCTICLEDFQVCSKIRQITGPEIRANTDPEIRANIDLEIRPNTDLEIRANPPGYHQLPLRAPGRLQRVDRRMRSCQRLGGGTWHILPIGSLK